MYRVKHVASESSETKELSHDPSRRGKDNECMGSRQARQAQAEMMD